MRRAVTLLLALAACSSSANHADPHPSTSALRQAIEQYTAAFGKGDPGTAWSYVSDRCRQTIPEDEYRATVAAAGQLYPNLRATDVTVHVDGTAATATYRTTHREADQHDQRWVYEHRQWHYDGC